MCRGVTDLNLLPAHMKHPVEQAVRKGTDTPLVIPLPHAPQLLEPLVLGPGVGRDLEDALRHVDEAHLLVGLLDVSGDAQGPAHGVARRDHVVRPPHHGAVGVHGAVVAGEVGVVLVRLEPATGLEGLEGLFGDLVFERGPAASSDTRVDEVEL